MKFAIIGTGFIFKRHLKAIESIEGELVDVTNSHRTWRTMIGETDADCIVILTPNDLHFEMALKAVKEGKIVLCEKPLTLSTETCKILMKYPNVFTVAQLRHHPLVKKIKVLPQNKIEMDIGVFRNAKYFRSWKGKAERSGGVLFNIGVHYFDLLVHLFGEPTKIETHYINGKSGQGTLIGKNYTCDWRININTLMSKQRRIFNINGKKYNFSNKENLSYENLHHYVYKDLLKGKGVTPRQALKSIKLIEQIKNRD